jgi:predicted HAD superfamily Cof-like phosphohydrolase
MRKKTMSNFKKVQEFHKKFEISMPEKSELPKEEIRKLRKDLLEEEYQEYLLGEENDDLVEIADALADMLYIIYGTADAYGIPIDDIFNEVHMSNMSKLGEDNRPIRREDGKILKGPKYFKPDIGKYLNA